MRKLLYLDIDGVLNIQSLSYTTSKSKESLLEFHLVERLNYLIEKVSDLDIVISSSWRFDMEELEDSLKKEGFKFWERVVGRTGISQRHDGMKRGEQILEDLEQRRRQGTHLSCVILDDDDHGISDIPFFDEYVFYFIDQTEGLTDKVVRKIISLFNSAYYPQEKK